MREREIRLWTSSLVASYGRPRKAAELSKLKKAYSTKSYTLMIGIIAKDLKLDLKIRVGYVKSGGRGRPAWVEMPQPFPIYGSKAFKDSLATIHIQNEFLRDVTFEAVVLMMVHELCHIVLNSTHHKFNQVEEVVDLASMFFGYGNVCIDGGNYSSFKMPEFNFEDLLYSDVTTLFKQGSSIEISEYELGYLSTEERLFASRLLSLY